MNAGERAPTRGRDEARERRVAREVDLRRQAARARLDDRLRARKQAIRERWHAERGEGEER